MISHGARPTYPKRKDRDLHRSFGAIAPDTFPKFLHTDNLAHLPDQNGEGQPFGCTNYSQAKLASNLSGQLKNPADLEAITHANQRGGYDIRASFDAARKQLGWFSGYYTIRAYAPLDYFGAFQLAQFSGLPELRSISWGTPWPPSWEAACNPYTNPSAIMPMPTDQELAVIYKETGRFGAAHRVKHKVKRLFGSSIPSIGWHDSVLEGYDELNGVPYYWDISHQGNTVGKHGVVYFPREVINAVMNIKGTVAITGTNITPDTIRTVSLSTIQWIMSFLPKIRGLFY